MKNKVTKFYLVFVVIAAGYVLFSMFSNRKVLGNQPVRESVE